MEHDEVHIAVVLQDAGFQQAFGAIRVKFKPTARDMQVAEESGTDLAQRVLKKLKMAQRKAQAGASAVRAGVPSPTAPLKSLCTSQSIITSL